MRNRISIFMVMCTMAATFLAGCSGSNVSGGGGTIETTNGVVGTILGSDETPASNTEVTLFPSEYDPVADSASGKYAVVTTDMGGTYRFSKVKSGHYSVLARNRKESTCLLLTSVVVTDDSVTEAPDGVLRGSGRITADVASGADSTDSYIYIPGTDIYTSVEQAGITVLPDVPAGEFSEVVLVKNGGVKKNLLRSGIKVAPASVVPIRQPLSPYSRRLILNTTSTGANVDHDVYNFPVLVRLTQNNFDFTQAASDGRDLVFTSSHNKILSHEIELWDAAGRKAALWVRVDTVYGNDSTQSIEMYWGNDIQTPSTGNFPVFDTAAGYQGVWHLNEGENGQVSDVTVNGYHGITPDTARPLFIAGIAGNCAVFNGTSTYITMPNTANSAIDFPFEGNYTVSVWVAIDSTSSQQHVILTKGYEQYFLRFTYFPANLPVWEFVEFSENEQWLACTTAAVRKQWVLLTGVRSGSRQQLYCNGELVDTSANSYSAAGRTRNRSNDLIIGKFASLVNLQGNENSFCFFKGSIDEVRILSAAQKPEWVRLCYMNQREDNRLVFFR